MQTHLDVSSVDIGARTKQHPHHLVVSIKRRRMQGRPAELQPHRQRNGPSGRELMLSWYIWWEACSSTSNVLHLCELLAQRALDKTHLGHAVACRGTTRRFPVQVKVHTTLDEEWKQRGGMRRSVDTSVCQLCTSPRHLVTLSRCHEENTLNTPSSGPLIPRDGRTCSLRCPHRIRILPLMCHPPATSSFQARIAASHVWGLPSPYHRHSRQRHPPAAAPPPPGAHSETPIARECSHPGAADPSCSVLAPVLRTPTAETRRTGISAAAKFVSNQRRHLLLSKPAPSLFILKNLPGYSMHKTYIKRK
jgi:hypothetical protein